MEGPAFIRIIGCDFMQITIDITGKRPATEFEGEVVVTHKLHIKLQDMLFLIVKGSDFLSDPVRLIFRTKVSTRFRLPDPVRCIQPVTVTVTVIFPVQNLVWDKRTLKVSVLDEIDRRGTGQRSKSHPPTLRHHLAELTSDFS
jgi:hypothetical protein